MMREIFKKKTIFPELPQTYKMDNKMDNIEKNRPRVALPPRAP